VWLEATTTQYPLLDLSIKNSLSNLKLVSHIYCSKVVINENEIDMLALQNHEQQQLKWKSRSNYYQ